MTVRYSNLDGLRFFAALTVLLFHLGYSDHGHMAVDLFFVMSGFVLTHRYVSSLNTPLEIRRFFLNRLRTLVPTYWLGTTACIALLIMSGNYALIRNNILQAVLMIPNIQGVDKAYPLNPVTWSLALEFLASLLLAVGLIRIKIKHLAAIIFCGWIAMATLGFYTHKSWDIGMVTAGLIICGPLRAIPAFCAGIILYRLKDHPKMHALPVIKPVALFVLWLALAVIPKSTPTPIYDAFVAIICAPLLIALLIRSEDRAPRWCGAAGRLSYPLYASHMAIVALSQIWIKQPNWLAGALVMAAALALAWCIAWANDRIQDRIRRPAAMAAPAVAE